MKILYISAIETNSGWGAEFFVNRGFQQLGVETICIDYIKHRNHLASLIEKVAPDIDFVLLQRADGFPEWLLHVFSCPIIYWASELVSRNREQDVFFRSKVIDHFLVHSDRCKQLLTTKNILPAEKITVFINGFDPDIHKRIAVNKDIPVCFVGQLLPRRVQILEQIQQVILVTIKQVFAKDMVTVFNQSKIVLNIHGTDNLDTETRIFEALACGSFVVTEKLSSESPFVDKKHLVEARDVADLIRLTAYYLEHEAEREVIAQAGYQYVQQKYTYKERAREILSIARRYSVAKKDDSAIDKKRLRIYKLVGEKIFLVRYYGWELLAHIKRSVLGSLRRGKK
jgi:glycosyltransferase involved in cell wall biosynthesis